jgi:hypothetical protein
VTVTVTVYYVVMLHLVSVTQLKFVYIYIYIYNLRHKGAELHCVKHSYHIVHAYMHAHGYMVVTENLFEQRHMKASERPSSTLIHSTFRRRQTAFQRRLGALVFFFF